MRGKKPYSLDENSSPRHTGLSVSKKALLTALLMSFFCLQLYHTITDEVHWPFSPMNLFSVMRTYQQPVFYFRLTDSSNKEWLVHAKYVVPVEHFRLGVILSKIYQHQHNDNIKKNYTQTILKLLNDYPVGFSLNEIFPSIRLLEGQKFVRAQLEIHHFLIDDYRYPDDLKPHHVEQVYEY